MKFELNNDVKDLKMVKVGDTLILLKDMLMFKTGEKFVVTRVTSELIEVKNRYGIGHMSHNELKAFEIRKPEEVWSDWKRANGIEWKTKGRKIVVKIQGQHKIYRGYANCSEEDEYSFSKGFEIAVKRAKFEMALDELDRLEI